MDNRERSKTRRRLVNAVAYVVLTLLLLVGWGLIEPHILLVDRSVVTSPDISRELDGTTIAFVSDIHAGSMLGERHVARIVDKVNSLGADVIILGGDYVGGGGEGGSEMLYPQVARLSAPHGVLAVLGNHESGRSAEEARRRFAAANILVLENDRARVRNRGGMMRIAGVEDQIAGDPDVSQASRDIALNEFAILVSHNPDVVPEQLGDANGAFDLVLSGHTHGGQVSLFGLWAPYLPSEYGQRFGGGWTSVIGVPVLVSRGAGVYILPIRFGATPQIHLIELRNGPKRVDR